MRTTKHVSDEISYIVSCTVRRKMKLYYAINSVRYQQEELRVKARNKRSETI